MQDFFTFTYVFRNSRIAVDEDEVSSKTPEEKNFTSLQNDVVVYHEGFNRWKDQTYSRIVLAVVLLQTSSATAQ